MWQLISVLNIDIEDFPGLATDCPSFARSPDSNVYKSLNPDAAPYIPSPTSLLRAFSAPASPEYHDGLVKIDPCSIDSPEPTKVTRRRHAAVSQRPPLKFEPEPVEDMEISQNQWVRLLRELGR